MLDIVNCAMFRMLSGAMKWTETTLWCRTLCLLVSYIASAPQNLLYALLVWKVRESLFYLLFFRTVFIIIIVIVIIVHIIMIILQ
jgi:hypothetical protein